ncbi:demethylmenaquinone methyltransferase [Microlunatus endophyticus]|uniref:Demethylmenaquinone methyltransferase n=1 Tax=Microlunatus endophyticus TaxID=1716077 RepID=A0A917SGD4_9ACTN|nr:bifunctional demethylmenaquinone methyltransferase/2-methoxy-6-polyprenyl-1,4-benzoquinol methylase UbiE [Microlunatus endophyticus]GGL76942.1 demethylmenaquinone methyltransferase [Microlunatus endophyticus]
MTNDVPANADLGLLLQHQPHLISGMFDSIAARYDGLDSLLSAGLDDHWRAELIKELGPIEGADVLDLCAGTGEVTLSLVHAGARSVTGVDFAPQMLRIAYHKAHREGLDGIRFICADALHAPVRSTSMDAVTMAFGLRNVVDPAAAVAEIHRVLRPGGRLAILELSHPSHVVAGPFRAYFEHVMPMIGRLVSHNPEAYRYLPESVDAFPSPDRVVGIIATAGFADVRARAFSQGVAHCYTARKL